jgi:hypothetical protein
VAEKKPEVEKYVPVKKDVVTIKEDVVPEG